MDVAVAERRAGTEPGGLPKARTGMRGLDEVTGGGLPRGRPTLVTGDSGTGKTLLAMEFLVRGARDLGEPGVVLTFEESEQDLVANVASLGFDVADLVERKLLVCDAFRLDPAEVVNTGSFDLEGLFLRLGLAVDAVGAKRVVIDTIEVLFSALGNEAIVRGEFHRLLRWLKDRGLTAVVTAERGREGQLTRFGIEEYVSDCVIVLDHRIVDEVATRRMRIAKYRGSQHGTNEYPFMITDRGFTVVPLTSVGLSYDAPRDRVSLGIPRLDEMLGGGPFRGSTLLVTGTAGSGKSTIAAHAAAAACARGERALYVSFEESPAQIVRNMTSVGIDLQQHIAQGALRLWCERSTAAGLESHLERLERHIEDHRPQVVVIDSIGSLAQVGSDRQVNSIIARHVDAMKGAGITTVMTNLTVEGDESTVFGVSSLIDTWLLLRNVETAGERNRLLFVIKSRGTWHSNQVREFVITDEGAQLLDVQLGPQGVVTGSARLTQLAADRAARAREDSELARRRAELEERRRVVEAQIAALRQELELDAEELERLSRDRATEVRLRADEAELELLRRLGSQPGPHDAGEPSEGRRR